MVLVSLFLTCTVALVIALCLLLLFGHRVQIASRLAGILLGAGQALRRRAA